MIINFALLLPFLSVANALAVESRAPSTSDKLVVAHFMIGNTYPYTKADWPKDIELAASKGIDGFALNIGSNPWQPDHVADAFAAAAEFGNTFKLFLSLDVGPLGCSTTERAAFFRQYINNYTSHPSYLIYRDRPLVSSFSGEKCNFGQDTVDAGWSSVVRKDVPPVWFVPAPFDIPSDKLSSFSSFDGFFNWDGSWLKGAISETFDSDTNYIKGNADRIYMAAASPWFFTHFLDPANNLTKNWFYGGDNWLFPSRWEDLINHRSQIDLVQIISWNDYGESHYIGPIEGDPPTGSNAWIDGFDHEGWLDIVKIYAQAFKTGTYPTFSNDQVFIWSRPHPADATVPGDTIGPPDFTNMTKDYLWATSFTSAPAAVTLTAGSNTEVFPVPAGIWKMKVPSSAGSIKATLSRNGQTILTVAPSNFTFTLTPTAYNFNAFVASGST